MFAAQKKSIQKSVRMTENVYQTVNNFDGTGFNDKFENLVNFCQLRSKKIQGDIDYLNQRKQKLSQELDDLEEAQKIVRNSMFQLVEIENTLAKLRQRLDAVPILEADNSL